MLGVEVEYVKVSKREQNPELQRRRFSTTGCERTSEERISSTEERHPQFEAALDYRRAGDVLVVSRLDRLGCLIKEILELVNGLRRRGVEFRSLREFLETTLPGGRFAFHLFTSIAESERDVIRERTVAGARL